jgi:3-dehydroquinate synthase
LTVPIWIEHAAGRYPVEIAPGELARLSSFVEQVAPGRRVAVITDRTVARVVAPPLKVPVLVVPAGESSKSRNRWAALTDRLLDLGYGRDSVVVALGGGVVGDLAGFVAATFLRGVPYVQVPTSLLAMVDASVGGKTGVNTSHGKNLVGAFHPPVGVFVDPSVAATLRDRDVRAGLVESIKHGLVADRAYLAWIDGELDLLLDRHPAALTTLIRRSIEIKGEIVASDERESGRRAVLNAGHTVAHALERETDFRLSHGDAVALGLVVEAIVAGQLGLAPLDLPVDLVTRFRRIGSPLALPGAEADDRLVAAMGHDKKTVAGTLHLALVGEPGTLAAGGRWATAVPEAIVRQSLGIAREMLGP